MTIINKILEIHTPKPKYPVLQSISKRFSPRVFSNQTIPDETINNIIEAARLAPSARNHQPWRFYWMHRGSNSFSRLSSCLPERNSWAVNSSTYILACYDLSEPKDGINKWALYDLGQAVLSSVLQAQELGYYCRQIGSFDIDRAKEELSIPDPYKAFVIIAIGKLGTEEDYQNADPVILEKEMTSVEKKGSISDKLV